MRKVSHATLALAEEVIVTDWETIRHKQRRASYGKYETRAKEEGALVPCHRQDLRRRAISQGVPRQRTTA